MDQENNYSLEDLFEELNKDEAFRIEDRKIKPYYELISQLIQRRNELGLTQKDLAKIIGTHQSRISKIESCEHDIRYSTLVKIAEALRVEVCIQLIPFIEDKSTFKDVFMNLLLKPLESKVEPEVELQSLSINGVPQ
jgi:transcriptional regulator with XRE-family HTH domain